jgi:hypothetical protein
LLGALTTAGAAIAYMGTEDDSEDTETAADDAEGADTESQADEEALQGGDGYGDSAPESGDGYGSGSTSSGGDGYGSGTTSTGGDGYGSGTTSTGGDGYGSGTASSPASCGPSSGDFPGNFNNSYIHTNYPDGVYQGSDGLMYGQQATAGVGNDAGTWSVWNSDGTFVRQVATPPPGTVPTCPPFVPGG